MKYIFRGLLFIWFTFNLAQCGESGDSNKDLKVYLAPSQPTVFLSDITVTTSTGEVSVEAPWVSFQMAADNLTDETLFIVGITFIVNFTNKGELQTGIESTYEPSDFLDEENNPRTTFIAQIPANGKFEPKIIFYLSSLPNADKGEADSFGFNVTGIIEAYTGTSAFTPNRNIRKKFTFTTKQPNY